MNLASNTKISIQICYFLTSIFIAICAMINQLNFIFWPIWLITAFFMQKDVLKIFPESKQTIKKIGNHFKKQSIYGGLILLGFIISS